MKTPNLLQSALMLFTALLISACANESKQSATEVAPPSENQPEAEIPAEPSLPYYAVFDDASEQLTVEPNPNFDKSTANLDGLAQVINDTYPEIKLEVLNTSNDTLYVSIPEATYLTQQMGSAGARSYLLETTYAFTELPNIDIVNFDFTEGDHAVPGPYTRKSLEEENLAK